jgi:hypothetical protein
MFATFPFPEGMTPDQAVEAVRALPTAPPIEATAKRLDELRNGWLYPADLIQEVPEVALDFPNRKIAKDPKAARALAARSLTALHNQRPGWLVGVDRMLDEAVAKAYGLPVDIAIDEALAPPA